MDKRHQIFTKYEFLCTSLTSDNIFVFSNFAHVSFATFTKSNDGLRNGQTGHQKSIGSFNLKVDAIKQRLTSGVVAWTSKYRGLNSNCLEKSSLTAPETKNNNNKLLELLII